MKSQELKTTVILNVGQAIRSVDELQKRFNALGSVRFDSLQNAIKDIGNSDRSLSNVSRSCDDMIKNVDGVKKAFVEADSVYSRFAKHVSNHLVWGASVAAVSTAIGTPVAIVQTAAAIEALNVKMRQNLELGDQYRGNAEKLTGDLKSLTDVAGVYAMGVGAKYEEVLDSMQIFSRRFKDADMISYLTSMALTINKLDNVPLKQASESIEAVMLQFKLNGAGARQFLNDMSVAVHTMRINGSDLLEGLKRSGSVFSQYNMDARTAIAAISALSTESARTGSTIGNTWKSVINTLSTDKARGELEKYNVALYDTNENGQKIMRDGTVIFAEIQQLFSQLDDEGKQKLATTIAGGKMQVGQVMSFLSDSTNAFQQALTEMENNSSDEMTKELLKTGLDSFNTKIMQLEASLQVLGNTAGGMVLPTLKDLVDNIVACCLYLDENKERLQKVISALTEIAKAVMLYYGVQFIANKAIMQGTMLLRGMYLLEGNFTAAFAGMAGGLRAFAMVAASTCIQMALLYGAIQACCAIRDRWEKRAAVSGNDFYELDGQTYFKEGGNFVKWNPATTTDDDGNQTSYAGDGDANVIETDEDQLVALRSLEKQRHPDSDDSSDVFTKAQKQSEESFNKMLDKMADDMKKLQEKAPASIPPALPASGGLSGGSSGRESASQTQEPTGNGAIADYNPDTIYGENGCTAAVHDLLPDSPYIQSQDLWVPNWTQNARNTGHWIGADQSPMAGDVAVLDLDGTGEGSHVVVMRDSDNFVGNMSSLGHIGEGSMSGWGWQNKIMGYIRDNGVKQSNARKFDTDEYNALFTGHSFEKQFKLMQEPLDGLKEQIEDLKQSESDGLDSMKSYEKLNLMAERVKHLVDNARDYETIASLCDKRANDFIATNGELVSALDRQKVAWADLSESEKKNLMRLYNVPQQKLIGNYIDLAKKARDEAKKAREGAKKESLDVVHTHNADSSKLYSDEQEGLSLDEEHAVAGMGVNTDQQQEAVKFRYEVQKLIIAEEELQRVEKAYGKDSLQYKKQRQSVDQLKQSVKSLGDQWKVVREKTAGILSDMLIDGMSFKDMWKRLWADIAREAIYRMMSVKTSSSLLGSILGIGLAGGGSVEGKASGGLVGFADGGYTNGLIRGAGTGTSDSILTYLAHKGQFIKTSNGEYIMQQKAVNALGVPFLDILNNNPNAVKGMNKYAAGGSLGDEYVATMSPSTMKAYNGFNKNQATIKMNDNKRLEAIMEQMDGHVQAIKSPKGGQTVILSTQASSEEVLNALRKNPRAVQSILGRQNRMGFR